MMVVRPRQRVLSCVAAASLALLSTSPSVVVSGAPVVVTDYRQLVGTVGSNDLYSTGERFSRYAHSQQKTHTALARSMSGVCGGWLGGAAAGCLLFMSVLSTKALHSLDYSALE